MKLRIVFYLLGRLFCLLGAFLILPTGVSVYYKETGTLNSFVVPAVSAIGIGLTLIFLLRDARDRGIGVKEGFLFVTLAWVSASLLGAFPFYLSHAIPSFVDSFFESASGFTTTGASILSDIEQLPHSMLIWRNFTQWIGGMGIIVLAVAILPQLSVGGMQLMKNEMPGPTFEQLKPRIKQTALSLWKIYVLFSALLGVALYFLGMPIFEAVCHVFGTMSTGGFSPKATSIEGYSETIQMVITVFMFLAGTNFVLHYAWLRGDFAKLFRNAEFLFFVVLALGSSVVIAINLVWQYEVPLFDSIRLSLFQAVSIITSTGFTTGNFDAWPYLSKGMLFLLMFVGGCAGSTGGGLKQIRLLLLFKGARQSIIQHIYPKAVVPVKIDRKPIPQDVLQGVSSFVLLYLVIFSIVTLLLLTFNIDFVTATSAVVACISNIGPGFEFVGPAQNYAFFPPALKLILCACMVIGRLELFTVLVLFVPATWRS
jgi:trk system potassium uptake protein